VARFATRRRIAKSGFRVGANICSLRQRPGPAGRDECARVPPACVGAGRRSGRVFVSNIPAVSRGQERWFLPGRDSLRQFRAAAPSSCTVDITQQKLDQAASRRYIKRLETLIEAMANVGIWCRGPSSDHGERRMARISATQARTKSRIFLTARCFFRPTDEQTRSRPTRSGSRAAMREPSMPSTAAEETAASSISRTVVRIQWGDRLRFAPADRRDRTAEGSRPSCGIRTARSRGPVDRRNRARRSTTFSRSYLGNTELIEETAIHFSGFSP